MNKIILGLVTKSINELNEETKNSSLFNPTEETELYGVNGNIDSLALVYLISMLEQKINNEFGKVITLADESAMSQRRSPFKSVGTLSEYIRILLCEEG